MVRRIIEIDQEKCNGCGLCARACHEGAIGMIDGKARLLRDDYCDGLGDCLPACPTGAMDLSTLLWEDGKCISCMACVSACPTGALGFSAAQLAEKLTANCTARRPVETFLGV